jgi:SAM-dependent methyltransferase
MYEPAAHIRVGRIIRRHSTNPEDIRRVAARLLPLSRTTSILDLGCGYGLFYEALQEGVRPGTRVVGIDGNPGNGPYFEARVREWGGTPAFLPKSLPATLPFPDAGFDVILSFFSLYFFVEMLPEIRRLLKPDGVFLAVTHCRESLRELNRMVADERIFEILARFNDANGKAILQPHFTRIEEIDYPNDLVFGPDEEALEDLFFYLDFKRPLWLAQAQVEAIKARVGAQAGRESVTLTKNDILFRCEP